MATKKLLAVASAGGHWIQLLRLRPAFEGFEVRYMSTDPTVISMISPNRLYVVRDASMWNKPGLIFMAMQVLWVVARYRPQVIITTGAAPGFFSLVAGKLIGAKTIWLDSIANAEELSLAGQKARPWADHWLTQWPELERDNGPRYIGSVI